MSYHIPDSCSGKLKAGFKGKISLERGSAEGGAPKKHEREEEREWHRKKIKAEGAERQGERELGKQQ